MAKFQITPFPGLVENTDFNFGSFYLYNIFNPPSYASIKENNATSGWGGAGLVNWQIYDGDGSGAKLVGHAQGMQIHAGVKHQSFTLVFENGSSTT
ncbi:hypothetical protein CFC21_020149 [Triticum aestivum]|uniref:Dirigent protein n=2 Tax=Triticum aestivum TaxID=4565 RepID=A0A3B6B9U2_WHEAT|nr:hypothetical protein CFC21_020149 [Triticum aestivum]